MTAAGVVAIVDDDAGVSQALARLIESVGIATHRYASGSDFLASWPGESPACVLLDIRMPGMNGFAVQEQLQVSDPDLPVLFLTSHGDVQSAVRALKHGAVDFFEKPDFNREELLERIQQCLRLHEQRCVDRRRRQAVAEQIARLTPREREVMERVVAGNTNKHIAADLAISERTVEIHRHHVMQKMEVTSLAELVRQVEMADAPIS